MTFEDPTEDIVDENGDVSEETIEDFSNDLYDVMLLDKKEKEIENEIDRDEFVRAVKDALCKHYL